MRWPKKGDTLRSRTGAEYVIVDVCPAGFRLKRPGTGSQVTVTRAKCEKAMGMARPIPFRSIDGTSAIETGVAFACGLIPTDNGWDEEGAAQDRAVGDAVSVLFDLAWCRLPLHAKEDLLEGIIEVLDDDDHHSQLTGEGRREALVEDAKGLWIENAYSGDIALWISTLSNALDALSGGEQ